MEFALGLGVGMLALLIARLVLVRKVETTIAELPPAEPATPVVDTSRERAAIAGELAAYEAEQREQIERRVRDLALTTLQRLHLEVVPEASTDVVTLPAEDIKGRLIGREGRNIRAFEQATGVDLIIDDSPNTVVLSCFDPYRRAVARRCLEQLITEIKVHPARIEAAYAEAKQQIDQRVREVTDRAVAEVGIKKLPAPIREALGKLHFRTSYAQNVLAHSVEVAQMCGMLADALGLNREVAVRAGLLHDIGKGLPPEWEGPHALAGMRFLASHGEAEAVTHAVGAHHREIAPSTPEAEMVIVADALSAARPGARRENLEQFMQRMAALEAEIGAHPGVDRVFAVQAGREIRVVVRPDEISDGATASLAQQLAEQIAADHRFPGQIKVTVIREVRSEFTAG